MKSFLAAADCGCTIYEDEGQKEVRYIDRRACRLTPIAEQEQLTDHEWWTAHRAEIDAKAKPAAKN